MAHGDVDFELHDPSQAISSSCLTSGEDVAADIVNGWREHILPTFVNSDRERMSMSGMDSDILQDDNASLCAAIQSDVAAFLEGLPRLNADAPAFLPSSQQQVSAHGSKREKDIWAPDGPDGFCLLVPSQPRPEKPDVKSSPPDETCLQDRPMVQKTDEVAVPSNCSGVYCNVCNMVLNGDTQFDNHVRGKKHRNKVKKQMAE